MAVIPLLARSIGCNDRMVGVVTAARKTGKLLGDVPAGMLFSSQGPSKTMQVRQAQEGDGGGGGALVTRRVGDGIELGKPRARNTIEFKPKPRTL